ncbi:MAG: hypothetical protein H7835_20705, partial [Magnetococcus sp. XQGC-1]
MRSCTHPFKTLFLAALSALGATTPAWAAEADSLAEVSVTATREGELKSETAATVTIFKPEQLQERRPTHPKDLMNQVPGVWMSNLS